MKQLILLCAGFWVSVCVNGQTARSNFDPPVKLKVTLTKDILLIVYDNKEIPDANIRVLDSLMKKVPDPKLLKVEFEGINAGPEKIRSVDSVLKQCRCHVTGHFISRPNF